MAVNVVTITKSYKNANSSVPVVCKNDVVSGDTEIAVDVVVPASISNHTIVIPAVAYASLQAFCIGLTKIVGDAGTPGNVTITTNGNVGTGHDKFICNITNGAEWSINDLAPATNPITESVTSLHITNAGTAALQLRIRFLLNNSSL